MGVQHTNYWPPHVPLTVYNYTFLLLSEKDTMIVNCLA